MEERQESPPMRKKYDSAFKAKIAMEEIRGEKSVQEIAGMYGIHPNVFFCIDIQSQYNGRNK